MSKGTPNLIQRLQSQRLGWLMVLLGVLFTACSPQEPEAQPTPAVSPTPVLPSPSPTVTPSASPTSQQVYREKSGLFQIAFPKGYTHKTTGSGVAFVSADQGFAGAIDFGSADGKQLTTQQLEASLKAEFTNRLQEVKWQTAQVQPDGSLRLDWTGKDKTGNNLDAVSIVEQRGNTIFVLNLFGVNKPYQNYNTDAEAIVNSYQIQPPAQPAPPSSPPSPAGRSKSASPTAAPTPSSPQPTNSNR
ncbi:MAG: hypothetical protein HC827_17355 [Cyanobacteria bacterium RM1_2_2]|nr:hypothetical protein [Cyanobacteria bacterium RM1_2_2]